MRFQVPQFIDVESKILGSLTFKQFAYLFGAGGIVFFLYAALPMWMVFLFGLPVAAFAAALAFYKVNNQPFIKMVEYGVKYFTAPKLFLWKKEQVKKTELPKMNAADDAAKAQTYAPRLAKSKLKDLAWSLDAKEQIK